MSKSTFPLLAILLFPLFLPAQLTPTQPPCAISGTAAIGQVPTATANGVFPPCTWQAAGGGGGGTVTSVGWTGGIVSVGTPTTTPAFTVAGTSGGLPYFNSASTWTSSAAGTAGHVVLWGGAGSAPTDGGVPATGSVTSVGFTGGLLSVATPTSTPAITVAGTSGGVPYFNSASTWASSAAGTINHVMGWGGAGAAPVDLGALPAGTVTSIATTGPITGGTITGSGTIACATCATAAASGSLTTSGAFAVTLTATATTGVTLPNTGTLATLAGSETLSAKTLTTPIIGQINDVNGNAELIATATASAVNQITIVNSITGANPIISATGTDSNIGFDIKPKGANARVRLVDSSGNPVLVTNDNQGDAQVFIKNFNLCNSLTASTFSGMSCNITGTNGTLGSSTDGDLTSGVGFRVPSNRIIDFSSTTATSGTQDVGIDRDAAGVVGIYTGTAQGTTAANYRDLKLRTLLNGFQFSAAGTALPTCNAGEGGARAVVSDATAPTFLGTYISGGSTITGVFCNGTAWVTD